MINREEEGYYCPWCKINFSDTDKNKNAICPLCKRGREDGLNLLKNGDFECSLCGRKFSHDESKKGKPICVSCPK